MNTFGLGVSFGYDTNGMLTNITDVVGIKSSFDYAYSNVKVHALGRMWDGPHPQNLQ